MFSIKAFTLLLATLPGFFYLPLLMGNPKRMKSSSLLWIGLLAGALSAFSIMLLKSFFIKGTLNPPSKETLTVTLFVSFIEAGLLEECFKNGFYLFTYQLLKKKFDFEANKYLYFVLGAAVGLGFGILENGSYALNPNVGEVSIVFGRLYTTIPAHMMMNILFAYLHSKKVNLFLALLSSIVFHAVFDFFALPSTILGGILLKATLVMGVGFAVWMGKDLMNETKRNALESTI